MSSVQVDEDFLDFVRARQDPLLRAAVLMCGNHHLAQDLLQDALAKVASRWDQVRHGSPEAYIRRILYRDAISHWRKWRREQPYDVHSPDGDFVTRHAGPDRADEWVEGAEVRAALGELAPRQRAVLVLRYYEDLPEEQIAEILGISRGTVKSQASSALANLRRLLPGLEPVLTGEGGEHA
ncbi:SigE family RNA polymerase sigma factor [Ornithinimicrobium sp. F0845]|uniref:SigE family RNA polymerase sigma factor n=1 Tax=Ornithinimicrobium sp. F0845 TaxID=2926412 RepID=UPI001FF41037|nr:SigE family RNA polymerase sigma factor [Ornithinimicrobium sp. F0845]